MKRIVLAAGALLGAMSVVFGALGAHALKKVLTIDQLASFDTGVRYQMYHAIVLLVIGFVFDFQSRLQRNMAWCFIIGVILFSFSIYLLISAGLWGVSLRFLGPVTPLGGLLMISAWLMLLFEVLKPGPKA